MVVWDWIKKITDIIMPVENVPEEEEPKETKKAEAKAAEKPPEAPEVKPEEQVREQPAQKTQPLMQNFQAEKQMAGGLGGFTRTRVSTSDSATVGDRHYVAYTSEPSVRPSLAVLKTAQVTMKIYSPTKYDEQVKLIGEDLIKRSSVVVNYEGMDDATQQRIGDFILGVVYTINGHVEMISKRIFLYVPEGFEVESAQAAISTKMRKYT